MNSGDIVHLQQILASMRDYGMIEGSITDRKLEDIIWAPNINSFLATRGIAIAPYEYAAVVAWLQLPIGARRNQD